MTARLVQSDRTGYLGVTVPDEWLARLTATTDAEGVASLPGLDAPDRAAERRDLHAGPRAHVATLRYTEGKTDATLATGRPPRWRASSRTLRRRRSRMCPSRSGCAAGSRGRARSFYVIPERVQMDGEPIRTDARGSFRTAAALMTGSTYRVVVRADGFAPSISDWITLKSESAPLPPVTLHRLRTVTGRVLDRQGKPIAGGSVFQPGDGPSVTTDAGGRFQLAGARSGRSFLLARADGFRFGGTMIEGNDDRPVELTLTRPGEPPERIMRTLPGPIPADESRALARRVLGPYLKRAVAEGDDSAKSWSLGVLRWLDPAGLLEQVQKTRFENGTRADYLRGQAALGMATADPDEAAAIAESIADPAERAGTLVDLVDATPAADRARKLALLDRAALQARAAGISSSKLFQMGEVAERWLELGETEEGSIAVRRGPQAGRGAAAPEADRRRLVPGAIWRGSSRPRRWGWSRTSGRCGGASGPTPTSRSAWRSSIRPMPRRS